LTKKGFYDEHNNSGHDNSGHNNSWRDENPSYFSFCSSSALPIRERRPS
jgi:hypothetical protein